MPDPAYSDISSEVSADIDTIERSLVGATAREPIRNVIRTLVAEGEEKLTDLAARTNGSIKDYSDMSEALRGAATYASDVAYKLSLKQETKNALDLAANGIGKLGVARKDSGVPELAYDSGQARWVLRRPDWPVFTRFEVDREPWDPSNSKDSAEYSASSGRTVIHIKDRVQGMSVRAGASEYTDIGNPIDSNGYYAVKPMASYDYAKNELQLALPMGKEASVTNAIYYRPFITKKLWTNPESNIQNGTDNHGVFLHVGSAESSVQNGKVIIAGTEATSQFGGRPDGAIVTFQKSAYRSAINGDRSGTDDGVIKYGGKIVVKDNWDWNNRVSIFIPYGGQVTANMIDSVGNKLSRSVIWATPETCVREYFYDNGRSEFRGYEDGGFVFSGATVNGAGEVLVPYIYGKYAAYGNTLYGPTFGNYATSRQRLSGDMSFDIYVSNYFMVPVSIDGVYFHLTAAQDIMLRDHSD